MQSRHSPVKPTKLLRPLLCASLFLGIGGSTSVGDRPAAIGSQLPGAEKGQAIGEGRGTLKTILVIGGIGPQATMDFEARMHRVAQRRIPQRANSGYPPMVVYYHRRPPILLQDNGAPRLPVQPDPELIEVIRRLGAMADFLVIASNGPHMIQAEVERAAGRPVLSMVEVTLDEVRRRGWRKIGVLGMGEPTVYTQRLDAFGIAHEILDPERRARLDGAIFRLMEGREDAESRRLASEAVAILRRRRVDGIILGCTEIPLLLGEQAEQPDLVNPLELLAEAAVVHVME